MAKYKVQRVYVSAGTSETLSVDYEHSPDELYFWAFPENSLTAGTTVSSGTVESWIQAGKCVQTDETTYTFSGAFDCGYTVFVARKSEVETEPKQEPYAAFPLASLLVAISEISKCIENDAQEILRAMRSPEPDGTMILPLCETRKGRVLGFDNYGNPVCGIENIPDLNDFYVALNALKAELNQAIAEAEAIKADCEQIKSDCKNTLARCEEILSEILKYRYVVVTREQYDALVAANRIEEDVIYFVKGTKEFAAIFEELTQKITANEESITALKTEHDSEVKEINARLDSGDSVDANLFTKITELEYKHKEDIDTQEIALEQIREEIEKNRTDLNTLTENISASGTTVDEKLSEVESRLTANLEAIALEKASEAVAQETALREQSEKTIADSITQLTENTNDNAAGITEHENRITQMEADLSELSDGQQDWIQATSEALSTANSNLAAEITRATEKDDEHAATLGTLAETLEEKADKETGVLNNPVLVNALAGQWNKQMHPAIVGNANMHGWTGTLADLGCPQASEIIPTEITLYRRQTSAPGTAPRYLRILRKSADGTAWTVAYESENGCTPADFAEGDPMTWRLKNQDGRGAIASDETVIITQVASTTLIATAKIEFGAKTTASLPGAISQETIPTNPSATIAVHTWSPAMDIEYYAVVSVSENIATLLEELALLKERSAALAARVDALESAASAES